MKENNNTFLLIGGFVALIIAIALVTPLASQGSKVTTYSTVTNEIVSMANARNASGAVLSLNTSYVAQSPTGWKLEDCPLTGITATNASGTALVLATDYNINAATGLVSFVNTVKLNGTTGGSVNTTYFSYRYCGDDYLRQDWGRTSIDTTMGFFALACFLSSVAMFYAVGRNTGIIGGK